MHEFYYVTSGRGTMTIGDESREIGQGDLVYIPPDTVHSLRPISDTAPIHCFCFAVGVKDAPRLHTEERIATAVRLPRSLHEKLHLAADERQVAANLLVVKALESYLARLTPVEELTLTRDQGSVSDPSGTVHR